MDEAGGGSTGGDGAEPDAGGDETAGPVAGEGLPCEVDELLQTHCRSCHGPSMLAPTPLLTRADLLADSLTVPGTPVGEISVSRLDGSGPPMPPPPASAVPADLHELFATWVADGMPAGDCAPAEPEPDPFDVDPTCTSDTWWTEGMFEESPHMDPGRACITCHDDPGVFGGDPGEGGPHFAVGGTLYPTGHEPDDCFGVDGSVEDVYVELSHEDGASVTISINSAGNFYLEPGDLPDGFGPPYLVKVVAGGIERTMADPAEHGDCNLCHTQDGAEDAPGRILMPF